MHYLPGNFGDPGTYSNLKQLLEKYKKTRDEATRRELEREMR